jgi:hypothetical protein
MALLLTVVGQKSPPHPLVMEWGPSMIEKNLLIRNIIRLHNEKSPT